MCATYTRPQRGRSLFQVFTEQCGRGVRPPGQGTKACAFPLITRSRASSVLLQHSFPGPGAPATTQAPPSLILATRRPLGCRTQDLREGVESALPCLWGAVASGAPPGSCQSQVTCTQISCYLQSAWLSSSRCDLSRTTQSTRRVSILLSGFQGNRSRKLAEGRIPGTGEQALGSESKVALQSISFIWPGGEPTPGDEIHRGTPGCQYSSGGWRPASLRLHQEHTVFCDSASSSPEPLGGGGPGCKTCRRSVCLAAVFAVGLAWPPAKASGLLQEHSWSRSS